MYDRAAMLGAIDQCDVNIKTFEEAIAKERKTQKEYRRIIQELDDREMAAAQNGSIN